MARRERRAGTSDDPSLIIMFALALQQDDRHAEAVAVLETRANSLDPWPARCLLAYNALLSGDAGRAEREAGRLPAPEDEGNGAPPDPDEVLAGMVRAVRGHWLTGPRTAVRSPGPVPSNRF